MTSVRPAEFVVDADDPFKHDRLARQGRVEALCRLIVELQSPAVLAVNGPFGSGKSVFLRLCAAHLRGQGVDVVEFNAWQQSHTEVPLVDLVAALASEPSQAEEITDKLRQIAVKLAWRTASAVTHGIVDGEASQTAEDLSMFGKWKDIEDRKAEFQQELSNLVGDTGKLDHRPASLSSNRIKYVPPMKLIMTLNLTSDAKTSCRMNCPPMRAMAAIIPAAAGV